MAFQTMNLLLVPPGDGREPGAGSGNSFGAVKSERATFVTTGLRGRAADPLKGSSGMGQAGIAHSVGAGSGMGTCGGP